MLEFAAPGFLLAGALLALVPLALHMLARTPPERRPLPTARFLTLDRRTRLRLRRPTDLALLALRMVFLVLLGAAFARPEWLPERAGGSVVVLLDAGQGMAPVWDQAIAAAHERLTDDGTLVVFDTAARIPADPGAALDSLRAAGPANARGSYLAALRGLKTAAGALPAESASAVLVTRPRWGAWSPGVVIARERAWPARIDVVAVESETDGGPSGVDGGGWGVESGDSVDAGPAAVVGPAGHPLRPYATAALRALGYVPGADTTPALVVVLPRSDSAASRQARNAPHVVILGGPAGEAGVAAPWTASREGSGAFPRSGGRLVLPGGHALEGWMPRGGEGAEGSVVVAVWEDGRPAAAARRRGDSCVAYLAADPATPAAAADPAFPRLLRALANGCARPPDTAAVRGSAADAPLDPSPLDRAPLDRGALTVLRGDALPGSADLLSAEGPHRRSVALLLATLALLVALAEAVIAYGRRRVT